MSLDRITALSSQLHAALRALRDAKDWQAARAAYSQADTLARDLSAVAREVNDRALEWQAAAEAYALTGDAVRDQLRDATRDVRSLKERCVLLQDENAALRLRLQLPARMPEGKREVAA